jgi:HK97 family phage prohead protease
MKPTLTVPLEIKALSEREFEGHGSVFRNEDLGGDVVAPGAFKRTLALHKKTGSLPQMFWMHDPSRVPGKWLEMREDDHGLHVKGVLADTPLGNEVHTLLKMDAVRGLSIGYRTLDQDWTDEGVRVIKEAELWEVSVVSLPMNPLAQVAHVKSQLSAAGEYVPTPRDFERILRDVGCSRMVAKTILAKLFDPSGLRDAGPAPRDAGIDGVPDVADAVKEAMDRIMAATVRLPDTVR